MSNDRTAILGLQLKVADNTIERQLANIRRGVDLPTSSFSEQTMRIEAGATVPKSFLGDADAVLLVVVPKNKVSITVQLETVSFDVETEMPLVLPLAIVSLLISSVDTDVENSVYIFQGY